MDSGLANESNAGSVCADGSEPANYGESQAQAGMSYLDQQILNYMQEKMKAEINDLSRKSRWYGRVEILFWMFIAGVVSYMTLVIANMK